MYQTLSHIAEIISGYQTSTSLKSNLSDDFRLIQGKDFDDKHQLNEKQLLHFSPQRKPDGYLVYQNDVLFQARGSNHFAYHLNANLPKTLISSSLYIIRLNHNKILANYLTWQLNQITAQNYFNTHAKSSVISYISKNTLEQTEIMIPSLNVQRKICEAIKLQTKETIIQNEILKKRSQLINKICLNASQARSNIE